MTTTTHWNEQVHSIPVAGSIFIMHSNIQCGVYKSNWVIVYIYFQVAIQNTIIQGNEFYS